MTLTLLNYGPGIFRIFPFSNSTNGDIPIILPEVSASRELNQELIICHSNVYSPFCGLTDVNGFRFPNGYHGTLAFTDSSSQSPQCVALDTDRACQVLCTGDLEMVVEYI